MTGAARGVYESTISGACVFSFVLAMPMTSKSLITTEVNMPTKNEMRPIHPGEIIREEYLRPLEMSVNALAHHLRVPSTRLHEIVNERRAITADTAMRLAQFFGGDAQSWLNLQSAYDLRQAEIRSAAKISEEVRPYSS